MTHQRLPFTSILLPSSPFMARCDRSCHVSSLIPAKSSAYTKIWDLFSFVKDMGRPELVMQLHAYILTYGAYAVPLHNGQIPPMPKNMTVGWPATSLPHYKNPNISKNTKQHQQHRLVLLLLLLLLRSLLRCVQIPNRSPNSTEEGTKERMGMGSITLNSSGPNSSGHTHKVFFLCNYILLGAASSCIFLTLSLRLLPSLCGFFVILLHVFAIVGAVSGCTAASSGTWRWYAAHMVTTVLTAIFQGSVSVLVFTTTDNFLGSLKSYVREDDAAIILKMAGGLGVLIFCLEWVVLTLAFFLKYYTVTEGEGGTRRTAKVQEENPKDWPWPFQV